MTSLVARFIGGQPRWGEPAGVLGQPVGPGLAGGGTRSARWCRAADVRGRQLARLLIVGPVAIVLAAVLPGIAAPDRYPWVLALVPALLGGGAGLILVRSAFGAYPMPGQRTGSPFAAGGNPGILRVAFQLGSTLLLAVVAAPVLAVLALTTGAVAWLGVPVGLGAGGYEVRPVE